MKCLNMSSSSANIIYEEPIASSPFTKWFTVSKFYTDKYALTLRSQNKIHPEKLTYFNISDQVMVAVTADNQQTPLFAIVKLESNYDDAIDNCQFLCLERPKQYSQSLWTKQINEFKGGGLFIRRAYPMIEGQKAKFNIDLGVDVLGKNQSLDTDGDGMLEELEVVPLLNKWEETFSHGSTVNMKDVNAALGDIKVIDFSYVAPKPVSLARLTVVNCVKANVKLSSDKRKILLKILLPEQEGYYGLKHIPEVNDYIQTELIHELLIAKEKLESRQIRDSQEQGQSEPQLTQWLYSMSALNTETGTPIFENYRLIKVSKMKGYLTLTLSRRGLLDWLVEGVHNTCTVNFDAIPG